MRTVFRLMTGAALLGALAVGAGASASATPTLVPTFSLGVSVPSTVVRGDVVTASASITNLTESAAVANVTWTVVPPKMTARTRPMTGHFSVQVPPLQTVTKEITFKVPLTLQLGTYSFSINCPGALAPAAGTFEVK
jgi:hypothetical protein